jgi:hypothetical protein
MPLDEEAAGEFRFLVEAEIEDLVAQVQGQEHGLEDLEDLGLLLDGATAGESVSCEVSG